MKAKLNTDGGARGNPGPAGIGIVLRDDAGDILLEHSESIGETTNNVAEYKALVKGLQLALEQGITEIDVYLDSELVVSQVRGEWKIKNETLRPLAVKAEVLLRKFGKASLHHVRRNLNVDADRLANEAMDEAAAGRAYLESERQLSLDDELIFWHLGIAMLLVYLTLGRRRIDYRYILLGAVLPDLIDGLISAIFDLPTRSYSHTLLSVIAVAVVVLLGTKGETRLAVFGLAVGWLTHLVADVMWQVPRTFLWPAFGTGFPGTPAEPYSWALFTHPMDHLAQWVGEVVGLAILAWFFVAFELNKGDRLKVFLSDGYLRP